MILNEMRGMGTVLRAVLREAGWCEGRPIAMILDLFYKCQKGQEWWGGADPPGVVFSYIPSRAGEQAERLLRGFDGILQVDPAINDQATSR